MEVYITYDRTYDRYDRNEWFYIYQITGKMSEVRKDLKNNLTDFIGSGPNDCHSYQIQVVNLTQDEVEKLKTKVQNPIEYGDELYELMCKIYEKCDFGPTTANCLLSTDGCSDNVELVYFYMKEQGIDVDNKTPEELEDLFYAYEKMVLSDNDLYNEALYKYIDENYTI